MKYLDYKDIILITSFSFMFMTLTGFIVYIIGINIYSQDIEGSKNAIFAARYIIFPLIVSIILIMNIHFIKRRIKDSTKWNKEKLRVQKMTETIETKLEREGWNYTCNFAYGKIYQKHDARVYVEDGKIRFQYEYGGTEINHDYKLGDEE